MSAEATPEQALSASSVVAQREHWLSMAYFEGARNFVGRISTQSLLLEYDLRLAFAAGAWLSVIVIAFASIEAQFRHVHKEDYESKAISLFGSDQDLHWLRELRNEVVHAPPPGSRSLIWTASSNDIRETQAALQVHAQRAVKVMLRSNYGRVRS